MLSSWTILILRASHQGGGLQSASLQGEFWRETVACIHLCLNECIRMWKQSSKLHIHWARLSLCALVYTAYSVEKDTGAYKDVHRRKQREDDAPPTLRQTLSPLPGPLFPVLPASGTLNSSVNTPEAWYADPSVCEPHS